MTDKNKELDKDLENEGTEEETEGEQSQDELTPEQLKEQLDKERAEKEKWKSRFKKNAAKIHNEKEEDRDVDAIVEQKLQEREVKSKVDHVMGQLPEKYREVFESEFKELSDWKTLTSDNVDKYIKSAMALSIPDDSVDVDAIKAISVGGGKSLPKGEWGKKTSKDLEYSKQFLKDQGII
jgi:hypothetical protein